MANVEEATDSTSLSDKEKRILGLFFFLIVWIIVLNCIPPDPLPKLSIVSISVFFAIVMYCWWYRKNENPPFKPPGGGKLLFAGAFTDKTHRWNVLVDVALVAFGLFAASYVINPEAVGGLYFAIGFSFSLSVPATLLVVIPKIYLGKRYNCCKKEEKEKGFCGFRGVNEWLAEQGGTVEWQPSSVYADPSISFWPLLFQVFVPQLAAMVLYVLSFFFGDPDDNTWVVVYALCGALFGPITLTFVNLPYSLMDHYLFAAAGDHDIVLKANPTSTRNIGEKIVFDYGKVRCFIHFLSDVVGPFFLIFSLPVFLAKESGSQGEFVLNAMAMIFVITLDDIPVEKRKTYTYTDPNYDLEGPPLNPGTGQEESNSTSTTTGHKRYCGCCRKRVPPPPPQDQPPPPPQDWATDSTPAAPKPRTHVASSDPSRDGGAYPRRNRSMDTPLTLKNNASQPQRDPQPESSIDAALGDAFTSSGKPK